MRSLICIGCTCRKHRWQAVVRSIIKGLPGIRVWRRTSAGFQRATEGINITKLRINQREMYEQYVLGNLSKYAQPEEKSEISGKYVFVALQIPTDVVSNLAWLDGLELLRTGGRFLCGFKNPGRREAPSRPHE